MAKQCAVVGYWYRYLSRYVTVIDQACDLWPLDHELAVLNRT